MFQYSERPCGCIHASNVADRTGPTTFTVRPCLQHLHVEERRDETDETMAIAQFIAVLVCTVISLIVVLTITSYIFHK